MEKHVGARVVTKHGKSCIMLNDQWFELDERKKTHVLIHELLHAQDKNIIDIAYMHEPRYDKLTIAEALRNADSIAELVNAASTPHADPTIAEGMRDDRRHRSTHLRHTHGTINATTHLRHTHGTIYATLTPIHESTLIWQHL